MRHIKTRLKTIAHKDLKIGSKIKHTNICTCHCVYIIVKIGRPIIVDTVVKCQWCKDVFPLVMIDKGIPLCQEDYYIEIH